LSTTGKNPPKSGVNASRHDPIPELICSSRPHKGQNDGIYVVRIPFKFMLVTKEAAFYEYRFIGMREEIK